MSYSGILITCFFIVAVCHPNTIAYQEKFFESAQAIAAHSHPCWPDLSREWIRRQEARIARVDWESRLPVVLGPRKSRISLFTRKQQKLLDEARKMDGVPDLSALLKGKLQLLSKKSTPANVQGSTSSDGGGASKERAPGLVDEGVGAEPSASSPKKKKKSRKAKRKATDEVPLEARPLLSMKLLRKLRKDLVETDPSEAVPEDHPRKKKKKKSIEAESATLSDGSMNFLVEKYDTALKQTMIQLGSSEKLAQARLKAIEGVRAEHKKANEKAAKEKEILRVKLEELEGKLKSARAAKKELARENTRSNVNLIRPETASQLITSLEITEEPSGEPLVDITSVPAEHVEVPEGGGLDERPENENLEEVPGKDNLEIGDIPVREEETKNVGIEDPVLVSDSSSEGREDEDEEDYRVEETSPPQPVEEETTNEVGDRDVTKLPPPTMDSLVLFLLEWKTRLLPLLKTQSVLLLLGRQRRTIKILCLDALPMKWNVSVRVPPAGDTGAVRFDNRYLLD
ncbi:hypothetical protein Bca52824_054552 [Brassica carinata]|uniref:Uncharacterized protein n=1 Tax=Brassica carinata TaxID=52824 RepID=A0A8X7R8W3_BRACI|nr:hypothetical protein Bca52824_054552 [Brassica carinata]